MGRPSRAEQFVAAEIGIVHAVQRCVRREGAGRKVPPTNGTVIFE
jgi:hypothetical protein